MTIHSLSLGAGVQSTALYLLNVTQDERLGAVLPDGEFAQIAIFADPGDEGQETYAHLWRLAQWGSGRVPVHITRAAHPGTTGTLAGDLLWADRFASIPAFTANGGKLMRNCTRDFKITPIYQCLRKHAGVGFRQKMNTHVYAQVGISLDEVVRMKPSKEKWETRLFPLIEMRWRRIDCLNYLAEHWPHPVGKSACVFCPFHNNSHWREMKEKRPTDFERACEVDESIRKLHEQNRGGLQEEIFLHRSLEPLREAYFDERQLDLWGEFAGECEGMCGV